MTKILIEIDTDTQRVVPLLMLDEAEDIFTYPKGEVSQEVIDVVEWFKSSFAVAPQPEPVDADLRRDAERLDWLIDKRLLAIYMLSGGTNSWRTAGQIKAAIDAAMSQGEQK